jgi:two-component system chemotaxis response regulator CheB
MTTPRIRVLIVEDTPVVREFMVHVLGSDPGIEVVGTVNDGSEALAAVIRLEPDVVTMDVHMPKMDGLEATRRVMQEAPVPIVIVSGTVDDQVASTFAALEAGALAFLSRPAGLGDSRYRREVDELVRTVKLMSEVKVVRRRPARGTPGQPAVSVPARTPVRVVAIGASTGGPLAIQALLQALPKDFPVPVLIVQHIAEGFLDGFVHWLNRSSGPLVRLAAHAERSLPGHVYIAPDGYHMGVDRGLNIVLSDAPPDQGLRPSVAHLLRSVREACGKSAAAVLLSGMGKDGAKELLELRLAGAHTFAQDEASSVVYGMPGAALRLDAARYVMAPAEMAAVLTAIAAQADCHV